ncbi:MAG: hypothetical protein KGJ89_03735 [Patescibacteria group bacterium]|nr:hypothetical protein [Patescibacteria group bacterium]MDE2015235.1 hypothetical protein [Patescibacteria group bacterium]MDE2227041.1 hypothetical protein [Patescibacteria group bacterium]
MPKIKKQAKKIGARSTSKKHTTDKRPKPKKDSERDKVMEQLRALGYL